MDCFVTRTHRLRRVERRFIADHLTRPGSDFQTALLTGEPKGVISLCLDQGEIVGWARTETWQGHETLESFVSPQFRRRGVATFAGCGLVAEGCYRDVAKVAVFAPSMESLARRLGLSPYRFKLTSGSWVPA